MLFTARQERGIDRAQVHRTLVVASLLIAIVIGGLVTDTKVNAVTTPKAAGPVDVLYAGSLLDLIQQQLAPAFHRATGYTVSGFSGGSTALANEIKGGTEVGDVFISASPAVNLTLRGVANGNWVSSFQTFGKSQLVLGYNPHSRFAKVLAKDSWFNVVDRAGFLLGRTDPSIDPKGVLAVDALTGVASSYQLPALAALATSNSNIFTETSLVGELQADQLDAGFFYAVEASAANIKTVPLTSTNLAAQYTVAMLNNAPHAVAARAFVKFLLGAGGEKILRANGITPIGQTKLSPVSSSRSGITSTTLP